MSDWQVGDKAYFLYEYRISWGEVVSVGPVNLKIKINGAYTLIRPRVKCARPDEPVAIIHEQWKGRNGRGGYRLDREQYTDDLIPAKDWMSQRKFDPVKEKAEL